MGRSSVRATHAVLPITLIALVWILAGALPAASASAPRSTSRSAPTRLPGFRTPSGNIKCLFVPGRPSLLRCEIARADYAAALQHRCMARASLDWHGFELGALAKGSITCSGGILYNPLTQRPSYVTLLYGRRWRHVPFTCWSRRTGVTCENRVGHGLLISRHSWLVW